MIIAQVCLRLATIKGHSKICSFITQHNATDVASFEGACNCHADCRNVHQSCCPWIECSFLYHKPSPKAFQRIAEFTIPESWKHPSSCMASILTGHVTHGSAYTTACSSSCQYPATSHSHWRGVDQHSTGHNQQPDQLYPKEMWFAQMVVTPDGRVLTFIRIRIFKNISLGLRL